MRWVLRIGAAAAALVACAWFVLGAIEAHEVSVATGIVATPGTPGASALSHAASELSSAGFLNPDRTVDILEGRVAIKRGQITHAQRILRAVTRAEPENLEAWIWLTGASLGDHAAAALGASRIAELDPLDAKTVGR